MSQIIIENISYKHLKEFYTKLETDKQTYRDLDNKFWEKHCTLPMSEVPRFEGPRFTYQVLCHQLNDVSPDGVYITYAPSSSCFKRVNDELVYEYYNLTIKVSD